MVTLVHQQTFIHYSLNNIVNLRINRIPGCINTVTFDPTSSRVAIGRKDGDIEITGMNLFYYIIVIRT